MKSISGISISRFQFSFQRCRGNSYPVLETLARGFEAKGGGGGGGGARVNCFDRNLKLQKNDKSDF